MGPSYDLQMMVAGGNETKKTKEKQVTFRLESLTNDFVTPPIEAVTIHQINSNFEGVPHDPSNTNHYLYQ